MGHESCAAVKAAIDNKSDKAEKTDSNLSWLVRQVEPGANLPKDARDALAQGIKNNAIRQSQLLTERSAVIKEFVQAKRVQIIPAVYALESGKVDWLEVPKLTGKQPVIIRVLVPTADTVVKLDGNVTKSKGLVRMFDVPPVDVDREYSYVIEAEWVENGLTAYRKDTVHFKGGTTVTVDFSKK
jgi:uncharacterized protein (TIGR03000 family)